MEEFIRSYGLWILLAGVFVAMHWFGMGCGGHRHGGGAEDTERDRAGGEKAKSATRSGGCH